MFEAARAKRWRQHPPGRQPHVNTEPPAAHCGQQRLPAHPRSLMCWRIWSTYGHLVFLTLKILSTWSLRCLLQTQIKRPTEARWWAMFNQRCEKYPQILEWKYGCCVKTSLWWRWKWWESLENVLEYHKHKYLVGLQNVVKCEVAENLNILRKTDKYLKVVLKYSTLSYIPTLLLTDQ